jgi:hypothetical protein
MSISPQIVEAPAAVTFAAVKPPGRPASRKYTHTAETDAVIRDAYAQWIGKNDRKALTRARVTLGWPKHVVLKRGFDLGLSRIKEKDWSLAEIAVMEANCQYGTGVIRKRLAEAGFPRSETAIIVKRKRMNLTRAYDGYSATGLAKLAGTDIKWVTHMIDRGWLTAEKRGTNRSERQGGDIWYIPRESARELIFAHPEEWDLRKVEKWWFLDLVTDGAIFR